MDPEADLFGEVARPPAAIDFPPGLSTWDDVVGSERETELTALIDDCRLTPFRFQGWLGKRLTRSFGWTYDFDTGRFERGEPMPAWLTKLREEVATCAAIPAAELVQALLIRYDPGAGISWHKDRPVFEHVLGLSLGNAAGLRFRRRRPGAFDRFRLHARPRSLYRLSGTVRHDWEHSIDGVADPRWSVTFRSLAANVQRRGDDTTSVRAKLR